MRVIKEIMEQMHEELEGSGEYIDAALKYKDTDKVLADMYYNMSIQEMKHHDDLHGQVVRMITDYRKEHGEPPKEMQAVYDWEHEKAISKAKEVKVAQALYKGQ